MKTVACEACGTPFERTGRGTYCGVRCRREVERRRRKWEAGMRVVRCLEANASMANPLLDRTPEQSREWKRMAAEALKDLGPRP
jgi:hypothetical protein